MCPAFSQPRHRPITRGDSAVGRDSYGSQSRRRHYFRTYYEQIAEYSRRTKFPSPRHGHDRSIVTSGGVGAAGEPPPPAPRARPPPPRRDGGRRREGDHLRVRPVRRRGRRPARPRGDIPRGGEDQPRVLAPLRRALPGHDLPRGSVLVPADARGCAATERLADPGVAVRRGRERVPRCDRGVDRRGGVEDRSAGAGVREEQARAGRRAPRQARVPDALAVVLPRPRVAPPRRCKRGRRGRRDGRLLPRPRRDRRRSHQRGGHRARAAVARRRRIRCVLLYTGPHTTAFAW